jgi:glutaminyl-peptide cyclotransferase
MQKMVMRKVVIYMICILVVLQLGMSVVNWRKSELQPENRQEQTHFDGNRALNDVKFQVALGPRIPGSPGHNQIIEWLVSELESTEWQVEIQEAEMLGNPIKNVIAKRSGQDRSSRSWVILGAHYDTRIYADQDPNPDFRTLPVPGANDGASGVAVLLELARVLPEDLNKDVWLVFFDAEDNGTIPGWDWILGSRAFVEALEGKPDAAVIVDMIGDADLEIYLERGSDPELSADIWDVAANLGYSQFIPTPKYHILDDHVPFLEAGIPALDIIDFDYPYWHTIEDTVDKVSAESLEAVGETLRVWLLGTTP